MGSSLAGEPCRGLDLPGRVAAWRAREAAFVAKVAPDFPGLTAADVAPGSLAPEERDAWNWSLPWRTLRREAIGAAIACFGVERLEALGVELERGPWGTSRCWPDARRRLRLARAVRWPSELLAQLDDPARVEAFLAD
ncbi:MAG: hypothetical protein KDD82_13810, partial [Planctomycetes bacterium]|nr:hypothetical protein [Planctomycetota bacterium]